MIIIGICGGSGCGKSTLSGVLRKKMLDLNAICIEQDSYYKDRSHYKNKRLDRINYDAPYALDIKLMVSHIKKLKIGKSIFKPVYDFKTHSRLTRKEPVFPTAVLILEGIHVFSDKRLRDIIDVKIFLDIDDDLRLSRRILRDVQKRNRTVHSVINQWFGSVQPMFEKYIKVSKKYADIVFNKDPTEIEIRKVINRIKGAGR